MNRYIYTLAALACFTNALFQKIALGNLVLASCLTLMAISFTIIAITLKEE